MNKQLTILFLLLLLSFNLFAQVKYEASFESGYEDRYISIYDVSLPLAEVYFKNSMFSTVDLNVKIKRINLFTDVKTNYYPFSMVAYTPVQVQYRLGMIYSFGRFELKYEHLCSHSIDRRYFRDGYDRISCKIYLIKYEP